MERVHFEVDLLPSVLCDVISVTATTVRKVDARETCYWITHVSHMWQGINPSNINHELGRYTDDVKRSGRASTPTPSLKPHTHTLLDSKMMFKPNAPRTPTCSKTDAAAPPSAWDLHRFHATS
jgi:hypothetical protein